jgi:predicted AAA+ superfamily ATPase
MVKHLLMAALLAASACHADSKSSLFATVKNWLKDPFGYAEERNNWLLRYEVTEHYGRGPLLQEIQGFDSAKLALTWLLQYVQDPVSNHKIFTNYILYGIPGSGKSGFVSALMREIKKH